MLKSSAILIFLVGPLAAVQLPTVFERNVGQARDDVRFISRAGADSFALLDGGSFRIGGTEIHIAGANPRAKGAGLDPLPGRSNYFAGADPRQWRTDIEQFARIRYRAVYPGIDLEFHGREYDFLIAPGADPRRIRLDFRGARPFLDHGDLVVPPFRQKRPQAYQIVDGKRRDIAADFVLAGASACFHLGPYDHRARLVIDPVVVFATFLGGSASDVGSSIAVDGAGNIYVAGGTNSSNFPVTTGAPLSPGTSSAFVVKLSSDGTKILYSTLIAAMSSVLMVVDASGNAYLTGGGTPPTTAGAYQTTPAAGFIAKLNPTGDQLLYSALINGYPSAITIDSAGAAYVTGSTVPGSNFVTTAGAYQTTYTPATCPVYRPAEPTQCPTAFVLKLRLNGSAPAYATLLGGSGPDGASTIAVDSGGNAIVAGSTTSANFPVANAIQSTYGGGYINGPGIYGDAFVSKLNAAGSALVFSTYLGGSSVDAAGALALDPAGNIYVNGTTQSTNFPTTPGAYETVFPNTGTSEGAFGTPQTGFVAKIAPLGSLVYSTFISSGSAIAVDQSGYVYLNTEIPFPNEVVPYRTAPVAILNPAGSAIISSGGSGVGTGGSSVMALDGKGYIYETGRSDINLFFATPGTVGPNYLGGASDATVLKIALANGPVPMWIASAVNAATQSLGPAILDWGYALGTVAPGEIITIYGAMLGPDTGVAAAGGSALPILLGGTSVSFDNTPAPLLYAQAGQINAIVPFEVQGSSTAMTVEYNGTTYGPLALPVNTTIPGIFSVDGSGASQAAVRNQDGSLNSASNPAAKRLGDFHLRHRRGADERFHHRWRNHIFDAALSRDAAFHRRRNRRLARDHSIFRSGARARRGRDPGECVRAPKRSFRRGRSHRPERGRLS